MLKTNVGCLDSFTRIFIGVWLTAAALYGAVGAWGFVGILLIVTGLSRVCPGYCALRLSTECCDEKAAH